MNIKKFFNIFTILALSFALTGFISCGNEISEDGDDEVYSEKENEYVGPTRICITVGNIYSSDRSTITPENLTRDDINKAAVFADEKLVKEWSAADGKNAVDVMEADKEVLIDGGLYDFTLRLYNSSNNLVAVSVIKNCTIEAGGNPLNFTTSAPLEGTGNINISLTLDVDVSRVGKVQAGLFTLDDDTIAVTGYDYSDCTCSGNTAVYTKTSVPAGSYYVKFNVYATDDATVICSFMDVIVVEVNRDSNDERTVSTIDELYSITYNKNGGEYVDGYTPVTIHNAFTGVLLPTETKIKRQGYKFGNWYDPELDNAQASVTTRRTLLPTTKDGDGNIIQNPLIKKDNTYTAQWTAITYNLTYKDKDDKVFTGEMSDYAVTHTYDTETTLPVPSRRGYIFDGWYTDSACSGTAITSIGKTDIIADTTYYAKWSPITYTLHFDRNDSSILAEETTGTLTGAYSDVTCTYDVPYALEDVFTVAGSVTEIFSFMEGETVKGKFVGWTLTKEGSQIFANKVDLKNLTAENGKIITLYAKWVNGKYAINFNANGGSGTTNGLESKVGEVTPVITECGYSRTGYKFTGWNTKADGSGISATAGSTHEAFTTKEDGTTVEIGDIVTLYAQWKANTYTVKFSANGMRTNSRDGLSIELSASGTAMSDENFTYDEEKAISSYTMTTPAGYYFAGWNTKTDGTGAAYTDGQSVRNLSATDGDEITLYPVFTPYQYTITYDGNSEVPADATTSVIGRMNIQYTEYDALELVSINAYKRTGYIMDGWAKTADGAAEITVDDTENYLGNLITPSAEGENVTLYAHWTPVTYNITFNCNGGKFNGGSTANVVQNQTFDQTYAAPVVAERSGYTFLGWAKSSNAASADSRFVSSDGKNASVKNVSSNQNENISLFAVWKINTYSISYDLNGGSWKNASYATTYTVLNGVTLPDINYLYKSGYAFDGWKLNNSGSVVTKISANSTGNKSYTAQWRAVCSKITVSDNFVLIVGLGQSKQISAYPVFNGSTPNYTAVWTSADNSIATVSNTGLIKSLRTGTTVVTVKVDDKLATCIVVVKVDDGRLTYDTGSYIETVNNKTYYTNSRKLLAFRCDDNGTVDFVGRKKKNTSWKKTTYNYYGYNRRVEGSSYSVMTKPVIVYDSYTQNDYVVMYFVITNTSERYTRTYNLGYTADIQIGSNDKAPIKVNYYGPYMKDSSADIKLQAHLLNSTFSEVTNVDHYWFGYYGQRYNNIFGTSIPSVGDSLTNTDSALSFCWNNITLNPGESAVKVVYFSLFGI